MAGLHGMYQEMLAFFRPLWPGEDKPLVMGEGKADSPMLMLIGEAPGETEIMKGRPFVGKAGRNLDGFLEMVHLQRGDIFVTNAVKIRPVAQGPNGRLHNRTPNKEEMTLFLPWLLREIALVRPKAVVTLGNVPLRLLTDGRSSVGQFHGQWLKGQPDAPIFCLYHPASVIYRRTLASVYEQDVMRLAQSLPPEKIGQ